MVSIVDPEEVIPSPDLSPPCGTGSWETQHERIVRRFKETGLKVCGKEWPAPEMICWILRGDTAGFQHTRCDYAIWFQSSIVEVAT